MADKHGVGKGKDIGSARKQADMYKRIYGPLADYTVILEEGEKKITPPKRKVRRLKFPKFGPPGIGRGRGG